MKASQKRGCKILIKDIKKRRISKQFHNESGVVFVLVLLFLPVMFGFAALAMDVGHFMVVRNELQNAADATALVAANNIYPLASTLNPTLPDWQAAETAATVAIGMNKSGDVTLIDCEVETGYWNMAHNPAGLQSQGITPGLMDVPAVKVTVRRGAGINGGPISTWFAGIIGIPTMNVGTEAIAVSVPPGAVKSGALLPVAISKEVAEEADNYNGPTKTVRIGSAYHYSNSMAGQWTSLDLDRNDVPTIRDLIANGNPTPLGIGDNIWIQPGTKTSLYKDVPVGADVLLPVVNIVIRDVTHSEVPIYGFIGFHITASVGGSGKYIEGYFTNYYYRARTGGPVGPNYGAFTPSRLVK
jgi:Flp pilus assembly protein TadG